MKTIAMDRKRRSILTKPLISFLELQHIANQSNQSTNY